MCSEEITVIVPAYNAAAWIGECLASIAGQSYPYIRTLVADDGSTDATADVARRAGAGVLALPHRGIGATRNAAVEATAGCGLIAFVDSDDILHPDAIKILYEALVSSGPEIASSAITRSRLPGSVRARSLEFTGLGGAREILYQRAVRTGMPAKLFRRHLFDDTVRFPEIDIFEDLAMTYRLYLAARKVVHVTAPLYHYRRRHGSLTAVGQSGRLSALEVVRSIENHVGTCARPLIPAARARTAAAAVSVFRQLAISGDGNSPLADEAWDLLTSRRASVLADGNARPLLRTALAASYAGRRSFTKICQLCPPH